MRLQSWCNRCNNERIRKNNYIPIRNATRAQREKFREEWRLKDWERRRRNGVPEREFKNRTVNLGKDPMVDALDFRLWLQNQVRALGPTNVASAVGDEEKMVRRYVKGEINKVHLSIVDRYMVAFGERATDLYPL